MIGASAGGVSALQELLAMLPADLPAAIGCVLHRGPTPSQLAAVLGHRSALPVREPTQGETVQQGVVYLAPADHHLLFQPEGIEVQRGPREHGTRPAVDPLFRSAASTYGKRVVGLLLTGAGQDGLDGMIAISQSAGWNLVQDPEEAHMPYMPGSLSPRGSPRSPDRAGLWRRPGRPKRESEEPQSGKNGVAARYPMTCSMLSIDFIFRSRSSGEL